MSLLHTVLTDQISCLWIMLNPAQFLESHVVTADRFMFYNLYLVRWECLFWKTALWLASPMCVWVVFNLPIIVCYYKGLWR